jgi:transcriptional regulator with XRE-family HTH domain
MSERHRVTSGTNQLDILLGGLFIGDNVVWHDDAGSLAWDFCFNFIEASRNDEKPLIYVSFDRSPRNLLEKLGPLAEGPHLTVLDCFTYGKGTGSKVFLRFYDTDPSQWPCAIKTIKNPHEVQDVTDAFYDIHATMDGNVRFVFESLTSMQDLWGGEEALLHFYSQACPRLYELNTIAYWLMEKKAHSTRFKARLNQIAQVVIDLSIKRGRTFLSILKAENRDLEKPGKPHPYWSKEGSINFDTGKGTTSRIDLGMRLRELRSKRGLSQTELAKLVGVTPSTISQVESNLIYPSLPALLKMAEVLSVDVSAFFQAANGTRNRVLFKRSEALDVRLPNLPEASIRAKLLTPVDSSPQAEPYLIEIQPQKGLNSHFFIHKGEEAGYLLSGKLEMRLENAVYIVQPGDMVYLTSEIPSQWKNPGPDPATLLWIKVN